MQRRILIVDDHAGFREWARRLLTLDGFEVVGEASDGASAIRAVEACRPRIVLVDVQLPDMSGFDLAARLTEPADRPAVVLTSTLDVSDYGRRVQRSGAAGFIAKSELTGVRLTALLGQDGGGERRHGRERRGAAPGCDGAYHRGSPRRVRCLRQGRVEDPDGPSRGDDE